MWNRYALGILMVWACAAQTPPKTAEELDASLTGDLRGNEEIQLPYQGRASGRTPIEVELPRSRADRPSGSSVSVAHLRHKPPKDAQRSFARGDKLSLAGNHARAAEEFEKAIARDPKFAYAHNRLGVEYAQLGREREAEVELRHSLVLDPFSWSGHFNLGVLLLRTGDSGSAESSARRALEIAKSNAQVHLLLGLILAQRADTRDEGLEHLKSAARTLPRAQEALNRLQDN
jgi:Flp pilus assembly protein TadD